MKYIYVRKFPKVIDILKKLKNKLLDLDKLIWLQHFSENQIYKMADLNFPKKI